MFGSIARDEATSTSDVDLLVEFDQPVGWFEFVRLKLRLEELLARRVDLVTSDALHPSLRSNILAAAARAWTRYTTGMTIETFSTDQKTIDAVIRNLQVPGEAARHAPEDAVVRYPSISWAEMRQTRYILIHE